MKVLVVGAAGQLGADLLRSAAGADASVRGLTRADLDVTDPEAVDRLIGGGTWDAVVNCTAYNDTAGAESDPGTAFDVNARAPGSLAGAARRAGARFVHVSTDYVFDGRASRPYVEGDPPAPLGIYGASKLTGEALARASHPEGTLVVRTAALFGIAGASGNGNFVETILRAAQAGAREGRPVRGVDDIVVSPTGTADLATGILDLLRADAEPGVYHLVNDGRASWYEFARAIVDRADVEVEVEAVPASTYPSAFRRPAYSVLNAGKAAARIGRLPHWEDALERYLDERATAVNGPDRQSENG